MFLVEISKTQSKDTNTKIEVGKLLKDWDMENVSLLKISMLLHWHNKLSNSISKLMINLLSRKINKGILWQGISSIFLDLMIIHAFMNSTL